MNDILGQLLAYLADGHGLVLSDVAQNLDVSEDLLDQMLCDLARVGYVERLDLSCGSSHCGKCDLRGLCNMIPGGHIWTVTEKGRRAAAHA